MPHVVRDRETHVSLETRVVAHPAARARVEQRRGSFFTPITSALPREPCAGKTGCPCRGAGSVEAPPAVDEQSPAQRGQSEVEQREHEQVVPEDVASVRLTVQTAGRDAGIQVCRVGRQGLHQVEDVQIEREGGISVGVDPDRETVPEPAPRQLVRSDQCRKVAGPRDLVQGRGFRGRDRNVARRHDPDDLLDDQGLSGPEFGEDDVGNAAIHRLERTSGIARGGGDRRARRHRDPDVRLGRLDLEQQRVGCGLPARDREQVLLRERAVVGHVVVHDASIDARPDAERSRPVLCNQRGLERSDMRLCHRHDASLFNAGVPAVIVLDVERADQHTPTYVELAAFTRHARRGEGREPRIADLEIEAEPIGQVDHALVLDLAPADETDQSVENSGDVRAGVMDAVVVDLGRGTTGPEVAVAERHEGLPMPLVRGVESLVHEDPRPGGGRRQVQLSEVRHDHIRARRQQVGPVAAAIHAHHQREATAPPGLDPRGRVFHDDRAARGNVQPTSRLEEQRRVRLARKAQRRRVLAVHARVEQAVCSHCGQGHRSISARGDQRSANATGTQSLNQRDRRGKRPDTVARDHRVEEPVLARREPMDRLPLRRVAHFPERHLDPARREE